MVEVVGVREVPLVTQAALDAGHEPSVERVGTRFRLVCSCGFRTATSSTRKNAFRQIMEHVSEIGSRELRAAKIAAGEEIPDTPPSPEYVNSGLRPTENRKRRVRTRNKKP